MNKKKSISEINLDDSKIKNKIRELLVEKQPKEPQEISKDIDSCFRKTNDLITKIVALKRKINSVNKINNDSIQSMKASVAMYEHNNILAHVEYILSNAEVDVVRNIDNYAKLQHNYYYIKNLLLEIKNIISNKNIENIEKKLRQINKESKTLNSKFEGIGSTVMNIILTITVVTTGITGISRINSIYIPIFIVGLVWLAMTSMVFINNLFSANDYNSKQAKGLYAIITILFFIIMIYTLGIVVNNNHEIPFCESNAQIEIE